VGAWIIPIAILGFFALIFIPRIHIIIGYADEITLHVRFLFLRLRILPTKKKEKPMRGMSEKKAQKIRQKLRKKAQKKEQAQLQKKQKKEQKKQLPKDKKSIAEILDLVHMVLKLVRAVIGRFMRHLRIKLVRLHVVVATGDAASTAIGYGAVTQAVNVLFPLLEKVRPLEKLQNVDVLVTSDFTKDAPELDVNIEFSLALWHIFSVAFAALGAFIRHMLSPDHQRLQKRKSKSGHKVTAPKKVNHKL